jgi:lipoate-protein ligase B
MPQHAKSQMAMEREEEACGIVFQLTLKGLGLNISLDIKLLLHCISCGLKTPTPGPMVRLNFAAITTQKRIP